MGPESQNLNLGKLLHSIQYMFMMHVYIVIVELWQRKKDCLFERGGGGVLLEAIQ